MTSPQRQQVQPGPTIFGDGALVSLGLGRFRDSGDVDIVKEFCFLLESRSWIRLLELDG